MFSVSYLFDRYFRTETFYGALRVTDWPIMHWAEFSISEARPLFCLSLSWLPWADLRRLDALLHHSITHHHATAPALWDPSALMLSSPDFTASLERKPPSAPSQMTLSLSKSPSPVTMVILKTSHHGMRPLLVTKVMRRYQKSFSEGIDVIKHLLKLVSKVIKILSEVTVKTRSTLEEVTMATGVWEIQAYRVSQEQSFFNWYTNWDYWFLETWARILFLTPSYFVIKTKNKEMKLKVLAVSLKKMKYKWL